MDRSQPLSRPRAGAPVSDLRAGHVLCLGLGKSFRLDGPMAPTSAGILWHASWLENERPVVVKTVAPGREAALHAAQRQALFREAAGLNRLRHAHVVRLLAAGLHMGCPVLVLERLHGSLQRHLQARQARLGDVGWLPSVWQVLDWVRQAALGIQALHRLGLRHLDLKPANLLLTPPGIDFPSRLKLADFGACLARKQELHPFLGTPGWLSPEHVAAVVRHPDGQPLFRTGPASDVFVLGQLLFALLTGHRTEFAMRSQQAVLALLAGAQPATTAITPDPDGLSAHDRSVLVTSAALDSCRTSGQVGGALADRTATVIAALCCPTPELRPPVPADVLAELMGALRRTRSARP